MENLEKKQQKVFVLASPPGSGKSTWAIKQMQPMTDLLISRDNIRFMLLKDSDDYFAYEDTVKQIFFKAIEDATSSDTWENIYIDATHLTPKARAQVRQHIKRRPYQIAVSVEVPLEVSLERNAQRSGRALVPESAIRNMHKRFEKPRLKEGFDEIWHIDVEGSIEKESRYDE